MDHFWLIASGIVIGVMVAAPIGPVNLICIRRTLAYGVPNGFVSGLGAAAGDAVFAAVIAFGLTAVSQLIEGFGWGLQLAGGVILLVFGFRTFFAEPTTAAVRDGRAITDRRSGLPGAMASTFALTVTNPATLLAFIGLFGGLGAVAGREGTWMTALVLVAAVFVGSSLWWLALTSFTGLFHGQLNQHRMRRINQASGVIIGAFGFIVLGDLMLKRVLGLTL